MICPSCGRYALKAPDGFWRCQKTRLVNKKKRKCCFKLAGSASSIFESSNLSKKNILRFIGWYLTKPSQRQLTLTREIEISPVTYVHWAAICREVCVAWAVENSERLGGEGKIVEIDETKFGKAKYNVGRVIKGQWVFGGVERDSKKVFLVPVERRDSATLLALIQEWILPGTTIMSDCWAAYNCLQEAGLLHQTVNHKKNFIDPETLARTQKVERFWRDAKRHVPPFGRNLECFGEYFAEFLMSRRYPNYSERLHEFFSMCSKMF